MSTTPSPRETHMEPVKTLFIILCSPGLIAVACDSGEYRWGPTRWRGGAELTSKGTQGHAALSLALNDDPASPHTGPSLAGGFQTSGGWLPLRHSQGPLEVHETATQSYAEPLPCPPRPARDKCSYRCDSCDNERCADIRAHKGFHRCWLCLVCP
jgi:hypothetical protein